MARNTVFVFSPFDAQSRLFAAIVHQFHCDDTNCVIQRSIPGTAEHIARAHPSMWESLGKQVTNASVYVGWDLARQEILMNMSAPFSRYGAHVTGLVLAKTEEVVEHPGVVFRKMPDVHSWLFYMIEQTIPRADLREGFPPDFFAVVIDRGALDFEQGRSSEARRQFEYFAGVGFGAADEALTHAFSRVADAICDHIKGVREQTNRELAYTPHHPGAASRRACADDDVTGTVTFSAPYTKILP